MQKVPPASRPRMISGAREQASFRQRGSQASPWGDRKSRQKKCTAFKEIRELEKSGKLFFTVHRFDLRFLIIIYFLIY